MPRASIHAIESERSGSVGPPAGRWYEFLFRPREQYGFGRWDWFVLALYSAVLAVTIPFHEQWADEAQAWLIARDSSLWDIFYRRLHYEGTPGLWHLILWFATRLHLPYGSINWISGISAAAGIYVFLRYAPFPRAIRYLLPFGFWLQYQYAVPARSYALIPLFAFGLCALFFRSRPRPFLFALLAGLMANVSLYSFLWAGMLAVLYAWRMWRGRRSGVALPRLAPAAAVLCGLFLFAFYTALPAPDLVRRNDGAGVFAHRSPLRDKLIPPTPAPAGWDNETKPKIYFPEEPPDPTLYTRGNMLQRAMMRVLHPTSPRYGIQTLGHRLSRLIIPLNAIFFSISRSNVLGLAFLVLTFVWLALLRMLRFSLPFVLMSILGGMTWINDHHAGLLFVSLITALWLSWPEALPKSRGRLRIYQALTVVLGLIALEQAGWSAGAVAGDIRGSFDPGRVTADFLKAHTQGKRVMGLGYETISALPFLSGNPFLNQPTTYWMYSENFMYWKQILADFAKRPDFFVVGAQYLAPDNLANQIVPELPPGKTYYAVHPFVMNEYGYRELTRFCGHIFMRGSTGLMYCNVVYVPATP